MAQSGSASGRFVIGGFIGLCLALAAWLDLLRQSPAPRSLVRPPVVPPRLHSTVGHRGAAHRHGGRSRREAALVAAEAAPGTQERFGPLSWHFRLRRFGVVSGLLLAYAWYYVCRYSLSYVGPALVQQEGFNMSNIGLMTSVGQIAVGFSKMSVSVFTADLSPRLCLILGLALTGAFNILAASTPAMTGQLASFTAVLSMIWAVNGIWQGFGSPACARVLDAWCRPEERGTFWSIWNTSNNLGGALAPILVGFGLTCSGWRGGLWVAGLSALGMAALVALLVRDAPRIAGDASSGADAGHRPRGNEDSTVGAPADQMMQDSAHTTTVDDDIGRLKGWQLFWRGCLMQRGVGQLACVNFLIYAIRATFISWFAFYILQGGRLGAGTAASLLSAFEVGGLFGSLASGLLSDGRMLRQPDGPVVGIRVETSLLAVAGLLFPAVAVLPLLPGCAGPLTYLPVLFCSGFGLYVAQALTALCGLELVPRRAIGVSQGFLGLAAYVGAASAGLPLGCLIQGSMGWSAWHGFLFLGCLGVIAMLIPLRHLESYGQREARRHALSSADAAPIRANEWPRARQTTRQAWWPAPQNSRSLGQPWLGYAWALRRGRGSGRKGIAHVLNVRAE
mmetsp:Transcript_113165/g.292710  ORF Transcript_113165/g.292710 Transcript_113165/m.292710 type:complete len:620 (+) Transcript_113165:97-1956(+)